MHLMATNLWTFLCYILYEEAKSVAELHAANFERRLHEAAPHLTTDIVQHHPHHHREERSHLSEPCLGAHCVFGETSELMYDLLFFLTLQVHLRC